MESGGENESAVEVTDKDIETSLFELYRAITHPAGLDYDHLLNRVRWQLMQRGHDVDTWPAPTHGR